ncbi:enoyl-CoA hydratase/isomerase family protein, partial [Streptomyces nojiriensis]
MNHGSPGGHGQDHVLLRTEGHTGYITLNRPEALNALTHAMVLRIDEALADWQHAPDIAAVVIEGSGE